MLSIVSYARAWTRTWSTKYLSDEGATAVEYGIMVALIAAVIIGIVLLLGEELERVFQSVYDQLTGV